MTPGQHSAKGNIIKIGAGDYYAAHVFDLPDGIAFIDRGWANNYPGSGQPCHKVTGTFEEHDIQGGGWIALDADGGDFMLFKHQRQLAPDGTRDEARRVLEQSLQIKIPRDTIERRE